MLLPRASLGSPALPLAIALGPNVPGKLDGFPCCSGKDLSTTEPESKHLQKPVLHLMLELETLLRGGRATMIPVKGCPQRVELLPARPAVGER